MMKNKFESLRIPGVVGAVRSDYATTTLHQKGESEVIQIFTAELEPGKWGFGFFLKFGSVSRKQIPGEHAGWFYSQKDAQIYAMEHIRLSDLISDELKYTIERSISIINWPSLFD